MWQLVKEEDDLGIKRNVYLLLFYNVLFYLIKNIHSSMVESLSHVCYINLNKIQSKPMFGESTELEKLIPSQLFILLWWVKLNLLDKWDKLISRLI